MLVIVVAAYEGISAIVNRKVSYHAKAAPQPEDGDDVSGGGTMQESFTTWRRRT